MFIFLATNQKQFIYDICYAKNLLKQAYNYKLPEQIYIYLNEIGYKYIFCKEFIDCCLWYFKNLEFNGSTKDVSFVVKILKDISKYYPKNPYILYICNKTKNYILKNNFINYGDDFVQLCDIILNLLKNIEQNAQNTQLIYFIENQKMIHLVNNIIYNLETQILLGINICNAIIVSNNINKNVKKLCVICLIKSYKILKIDFLVQKYINILKKEYM